MVNLDMLANSAANELFEPQGKTVNDQHYCTQYCWPFPTKDNPLPSYKDIKPWTPKEVKKYNELQRKNIDDAPM